MKRILTIIMLWLFWGFALGTALLLGPLRFVLNESRSHKFSQTSEKLIVVAAIIVLAAVSFALAYFSAKKIFRDLDPASPFQVTVFIGVPLILAGVAVYIMMNPKLVNTDSTVQQDVSGSYTIGPYPDLQKMMELKSQGYTGIITLLHSAVVPFEPKLLGEEIDNANAAGLQIVNIPFLPWISENTASVDSIRKFIRTAKGKYYINCYLGKDRVNVVRRIIEQENKSYELATHALAARKLDTVPKFERGPITKLEEGVFFTPLPTKEEYFGYIVASDYKQIVALYDKAMSDNTEKEEIEWLQPYKIAYKEIDVNKGTTETQMRGIVKQVKALPKPMIIHSFNSNSEASLLFKKIYAEK